MIRHWRGGLTSEHGYGLLELMAALPLASLLLVSLGVLFFMGVKTYVYMISDWELARQVQFSMEHIRHDLLYAVTVKEEAGELKIYCRDAAGPAKWVEYHLSSETRPHLMRNAQPVTGDSSLGDILITQFSYRKEGLRTVLFQIMAKNQLTGHTYGLESAVTLPRQGERP